MWGTARYYVPAQLSPQTRCKDGFRVPLSNHPPPCHPACEHWSREGSSHVIELKEEDPALRRELLIARYASSDDDTVSGDNKIGSNARTCAMADQYDIAFLKTLSECMAPGAAGRPHG
ncbi:hypothetical protein HO173_000942 [Letharia columbiana]|uniref:Uncharacterized protein n=1 Tax=Letharia columbiana TaxID=112416 RepID=A0A8H6G601_9LECA|nr:uncharacterized protein HO173_000942 [Letharia columbiana]KAF6241148.1 hypothetical protein HO173_000942 [Letharia columbiana]